MTRNHVYVLFSLVVTAGVMGWLVSSVRPGEILRLVQEADLRGILMFAALSLVSSFFRAWRYALLLRVAGVAVRGWALFLVVLVRNQFSDLLPARIGTLVYVYVMTNRLGVSLPAAGSSFAVSFLFDLVAMAPLLAAAGLGLGAIEGLGPAAFFGTALLLVVVPLAVLRALEPGARGMADLLSHRRFVRLRDLAPKLRETAGELAKVRHAGLRVRVFVLSVLVRVTKYASLYVFLWAMLAPRGFDVESLRPAVVFVGVLAAEAAASTPVSGIGGFGAYEGTWALVFELLGFPAAIARATSVAHHLFTQVWGYGLGTGALLLLLLPLRQGRRPALPGRVGPVRFTGALATAGTAVAGFLWAISLLPVGTAGADRGADAEPAENVSRRAALGLAFPGRIVFDSNRSRTFGIYSMRADGRDVRTVFDGGLEETLPDASPDGRHVVFVRAESTARGAPSSIWMAGRDGDHATEIVADGSDPTFSADGRRVFFVTDRLHPRVLDLASGEVSRLFDPKELGFGGRQIVTLRVSPDERVATFTSDRGGRWNAWGVDLAEGKAFHIGPGCEPGWLAPGRYFWVRGGNSRAGSGIYRFDRAERRRRALADAGPPRGHEYFPATTRDGRYLLYADSRPGEHSHVVGNYQIHVKDLATGDVARVTHDPHTNRWPRHLPDPS